MTLRKPLALLLSLSLVMGLLPTRALAELIPEAAGEPSAVEGLPEEDGGDTVELADGAATAKTVSVASDDADDGPSVGSADADTTLLAQDDSSSQDGQSGEAAPDKTSESEANAGTSDGGDADQTRGVSDRNAGDLLEPYELDDESIEYEEGDTGVDITDETTGVTFTITVTTKTDTGGTAELTDVYCYGAEEGSLDLRIPSKILGLTVTCVTFNGSDYFRSITIPATVTSFEHGSKEDTSSYYCCADFGNRYLREVVFEQGSPIKSIPDYFFAGSGLRDIDLPSGITTIGEGAFKQCLFLTDVTLPTSLVSIGDYAFYNAPLAHIDLPGGLVSIGERAFGTGEHGISDIPWDLEYEPEEFGWSAAAYLESLDDLTSVAIPDAVTTISDGAFDRSEVPYWMERDLEDEDCKDSYNPIATLTLGRSVATIGAEAFRGAAITTLALDAALTSIGRDAFYNCTSLESVTWTTLQLKELQGFAGCTALAGFDIPASVTTIGDSAFSGCANLSGVTLPARVATIGDSAFYGCTSLEQVTIPAATTRVGASAYEGSGIKKFTIVEEGADLSLGFAALRSCTGLNGSTLVFPERVTAIAGDTFAGLRDVTYYLYNDALSFDETGHLGTTFDWEFDEGEEGYDLDYGAYQSYITVTQYGGGMMGEQVTEKQVSVPNPWGGSQGSPNRIATDMDDSVVYYPSTVSRESSESFFAFMAVYQQEWALWQERSVRYYMYPDNPAYQDCKFIWPEFKTLDEAPEPEEQPQPSTATRFEITTAGDAGTSANVCVFDAAGSLVAAETANAGFTLVSLPAGDYLIVAFASNPYFKTVGGLEDFAAMGLTASDYATTEATLVEEQQTQVTLDVPAMDLSGLRSLVSESSLVLPKQTMVKNVEVTASISFKMAKGITANSVQMTIPRGLEVTSVASRNIDYGVTGFDETTRTLTITLDPRDAAASPCRLWVGLKPTAIGRFSINASVRVDDRVAPIGGATFATYGVVMHLPEQADANNKAFVILYAEPGKMVTVESGGKSVEIGPIGASGTYLGDITVNPSVDGMGMVNATVRASVQDGSETYTDSGTILLRLPGEEQALTVAPALQEFSFVHSGKKYYLVHNGSSRVSDIVKRYYTYVWHGGTESRYWTFEASYVAPEKMQGTATVTVEMLDGSTRVTTMALVGQAKRNDGSYVAHFANVMDIGLTTVSDPSLIPVKFDVHYLEPVSDDLGEAESSKVEPLQYAWSQDAVDYIKLYCESRTAQERTDDANQKVDEALSTLFPDLSAELIERIRNADIEYIIFHPIEEDPLWGEYQEQLSSEQIDMLRDFDDLTAKIMGGLEELNGFDKHYTDFDNLGEWIEANFAWEHDQSFDVAALEEEGFTIIRDVDAGGTDGVHDAGTPHDFQEYLDSLQGLSGADSGGGSSTTNGYDVPTAEPAWCATRIKRDAKGRTKSAEYRDANGNSFKIPPSLLDYDPMSSEQQALGIDIAGWVQTGLGYMSQGTGNALSAADDLIADMLPTGDSRIPQLGDRFCGFGKFLGYTATATSIFGLGVTQAGISDGTKRLEDIDKLLDELKRYKEAYCAMNPGDEGYSARCAQAIIRQYYALARARIWAEAEIRLGKSNRNINGICTAVGAFAKHPGVQACASGFSFCFTKMWHSFNYDNALNYKYELAKFKAETVRRERDCSGKADASIEMNVGIDPSGIAYEVTTEHPVEGVTATVVNAATGQAWDATEFEQENPQATGDDGAFKWDVPVGSWYVSLQKDGYLPAQSETLPVPPPQLDVNIPMYTTADPQVSGANADPSYVELLFSQYMDTDVLPNVSINGAPVAVRADMWVDVVEGDGLTAEGAAQVGRYSRVLHVPVPDGTQLGDELTLALDGARGYAGKGLAEPFAQTLTATARPTAITFNFDDTISLQVGETRPTSVRVFDGQGNPLAGLSVEAALNNGFLATVDDAGAVTNAEGVAKLQVEALLPGMSELSVSVAGTSLTRSIDLLTTVDANQAARPTATLGTTTIDEGAPAENYVTVASGTRLELACATEDATIYYTTDGSCPCQRTSGRKTYTAPLTLTKSTDFIIAAYRDGMDYSEKLHLHVSIGKPSLADATVRLSPASYTYDGKAKKPRATVTLGGKTLVAGTDYTVAYANNTNAGAAKVTLTGVGEYEGTATKTFQIAKAAQTITVANAECVTKKSAKLGAKASGGGKLAYRSSNAKVATVSAKGVVKGLKAGTATVTIAAAETKNYKAATKKVKVKVGRANTLAAKAKKKSVVVSLAKVAKAKQALASNVAVSRPVGKVTYKNASTDKVASTFAVAAGTGKITVPKGTKKGRYTVKIAVRAAGNAKTISGTKTVTYKVQVK